MKGAHTTQSLLVTVGVLILLMITGCEQVEQLFPDSSPDPVSQRIKQEVRDKRRTTIDIAQLTDFQWGELYVLDAYPSSMEDICQAIKSEYEDCKRQLPFDEKALWDEGVCALVFKRDGKIAHAEVHNRYHGDFKGEFPQPLNRNQAVFSVEESSQESALFGGPWFYLIHQE